MGTISMDALSDFGVFNSCGLDGADGSMSAAGIGEFGVGETSMSALPAMWPYAETDGATRVDVAGGLVCLNELVAQDDGFLDANGFFVQTREEFLDDVAATFVSPASDCGMARAATLRPW